MTYEFNNSGSISPMVEATTKSFRLSDAMEEINRQIERMGSLASKLQDAAISVVIPSPADDNTVPAPIGESQHTIELFSFANRIRLQNNRLESTLESLDLY